MNCKSIFSSCFAQISKALGISLSIPEDIDEFVRRCGHLEFHQIFLVFQESIFISSVVMKNILRVFQSRLSHMPLHFLLDSCLPIASLPIIMQERLLHFHFDELSDSKQLFDEFVFKLLLSNVSFILSSQIIEYFLNELNERAMTFNQAVRQVVYVHVYAKSRRIHNCAQVLMATWLVHSFTVRSLKMAMTFAETLNEVMSGRIMQSQAYQAFVSSNALELVGLVMEMDRRFDSFLKGKVEPFMKISSYYDDIKNGQNLEENVFNIIDDLFAIPVIERDDSFNTILTAGLVKSFVPDILLAVQTALKHPFLYLNTGQDCLSPSMPCPVVLYRLSLERPAHSIQISLLYSAFCKVFKDNSLELFFIALKTCQLAGQLMPSRTKGCVDRLNLNDSMSMIDNIDDSEIFE